jgi:hypothetical protein
LALGGIPGSGGRVTTAAVNPDAVMQTVRPPTTAPLNEEIDAGTNASLADRDATTTSTPTDLVGQFVDRLRVAVVVSRSNDPTAGKRRTSTV